MLRELNTLHVIAIEAKTNTSSKWFQDSVLIVLQRSSHRL